MDDGFLKPLPSYSTKAIHVGHEPEKWSSAAVVPPITTSTTFKLPAPDDMPGYEYARVGNPNRNLLEECLAALEGGTHAVAFGSGLGAISSVVSLLSSKDHIVSGNEIYGGTIRLLRQVVTKYNIDTTFVDLTKIDELKRAFKPNTKMVWMESPTNPLLTVVDIAAVSKAAKEKSKDIIVTVDNTFLTSYLQRPLDFGADIVAYSLTKYINGHSDVIMGAAITKNEDLHKRLRFIQSAVGAIPSPVDCYLVNRGLKTLAVRMQHHKKSSLAIAQWLQQHPKIETVYHPGLPSHPNHDVAKRQTCGHCGMVSFKHVGGMAESKKFFSALKIFTLAESLGGYESLANLPALMTHASLTPQQREEVGITDSVIRLSVGLEDTDDLIKDIEQALNEAFGCGGYCSCY